MAWCLCSSPTSLSPHLIPRVRLSDGIHVFSLACIYRPFAFLSQETRSSSSGDAAVRKTTVTFTRNRGTTGGSTTWRTQSGAASVRQHGISINTGGHISFFHVVRLIYFSREPPHPQDAGVVRGRRLHDGGGGPAEPAPAEPGLHAGRRRGRRIGQEQDGLARFLRAGEEGRLIRLQPGPTGSDVGNAGDHCLDSMVKIVWFIRFHDQLRPH